MRVTGRSSESPNPLPGKPAECYCYPIHYSSGEYRANVDPDQQHRRNRLLAALRPQDYALLEPHLEIVPIGEGEFLHLPGEEIEQVYFLHSGIVSLMAISKDGDAISTASVGREGAIGTIAGTGFVRAFPKRLRIVQVRMEDRMAAFASMSTVHAGGFPIGLPRRSLG